MQLKGQAPVLEGDRLPQGTLGMARSQVAWAGPSRVNPLPQVLLPLATLQFLLANQPILPLLYIDTVNRNTTSKKA
ncbi:hypothetical protein FCH83_03760 [Pseudomonas putida]|nr:hypothetical protein [Pseudomonas putida]NTZ02299.1 hypothetical protein [Pseudomonas putida]NTZ21626.1 hypothetical protein [Pseudomonas putida]NTZ54163.1 hypothetical protein [Pseudomonas putida]NTZ64284.1 hypothetical protein [Pseudomonas putida]